MSFKEYILNVHPDPDFLGDKKVYDAFDELDRLAQNYAKDKTANLTKELQEAKTSDGRGWKAVDRLQRGNDALRNQLDDSNDEITRLTREVEHLRAVISKFDEDNDKYAVDSLEEQLTRLRELLSRVQEEVRSPYMTDPERKNVLIDIDNALNPVYSPPYIEGKTDLQNEG